MYHTHIHIYIWIHGDFLKWETAKPPASILNLSNAYFRWLMDTFAAGNLCISSLNILYLYIWFESVSMPRITTKCASIQSCICIYSAQLAKSLQVCLGTGSGNDYHWNYSFLFYCVQLRPIAMFYHMTSYDRIWFLQTDQYHQDPCPFHWFVWHLT